MLDTERENATMRPTDTSKDPIDKETGAQTRPPSSFTLIALIALPPATPSFSRNTYSRTEACQV